MNRRVSLSLASSPAAIPLAALLLCLFTLGCSDAPTVPDLPPQDTPGLHEDEHAADDHADHDHHELGPHGGHIVVLDPGHYHVEWVHVDEENIVEVYLGDLAESANKVQLVVEIQGKDPIPYDLAAAESLGAGGYQAESPNLLTHIAMSDGKATQVTLVVETDEGTLKAPLGGGHDHDH